MAVRKRNQDEKNFKLLRELATLSCNKQCFDCRQRGPTYVNMTIGSFVCTTCSGILRGLNPPHRVKSISMTSFTPEDIEFIKARGNEYCRKVWFGLCDSHVNPVPESKDEQKIKDFMMQVYDKKKWWIDPSTVAIKTAQIEQMVISPPPGKVPLSSLLGQSHSSLNIPSSTQNIPLPKVVSSATTVASQVSAPPTEKKLDLLAEFGGDPFSSSTTTGNAAESNDNFANFDDNPAFSNSGNDVTSPANHTFSSVPNIGLGIANTNISAPSTFPTNNINNDKLGFPATSAMGLGSAIAPTVQTAPSANASSTSVTSTTTQSGDRYAALADLDSLFGSAQTTQSSTWESAPTSSSGTGWQTTATDIMSTTTTTPSTNTTAMAASTFGGEAKSNISNPFAGSQSATQGWSQQQQPVASQFPAQMWTHQPNPAPGQAQSWNSQTPGTAPAVASWMTSSAGQVPVQQSWNQQPMPSQAAFSTGNPFQMGQPIASNAPVQTGPVFPSQQNNFGANAPFSSGHIGSSTSTVSSNANSAFVNFNAAAGMNSGFSAFPTQSVTSPPDGQNQAQFQVQNGGFRPANNDNWNKDSPLSGWHATPQQPFQINKTVNDTGIAPASQFANWQQTQTVAPSNPFMASGAAPIQDTPKMNSSNPFL